MAARLRASDAKSTAVRKRAEKHKFEDEEGEEYSASKFNGFGDYFRRKKLKLQNLDVEMRSQSDAPPIFKGVVAHVNGYTQPTLNDLHKMIVKHGGIFLQYLDGKTTVTHIIASNLTPKKKVEFRRYRIVQPSWVVESIKAGKLLPWDQFRVLSEGQSQKVLGFDGGNVISQINNQPSGYRHQTDRSWYTQNLPPYEQAPPSSQANLAERNGDSAESGEEELIGPGAIVAGADDIDNANLQHPDESFALSFNDSQLDEIDLDVASEQPKPMPKTPPPIHDQASETEADQISRPNSPSPLVKAKTNPESPHGLTAEEHNARLLSDPKIWKSSVLNPEFIKSYYSTSRLHHLSTWKAELKAKLQGRMLEHNSSQKARPKPGSRRYVLHVDFDCFFAAVSLKSKPEWKEQPVVVAHSSGSASEVASCNYAAREFGVKNGMWMKRVHELCPDIKVLPYDFKAYETASSYFYDAVLSIGGIVQSVSIDEALIDISDICRQEQQGFETDYSQEQSRADELAQHIRNSVREKTGCEVSVGVGGNILLAKLALRRAKPAGQYQIKPEEVLEFIADLPVESLPGVAYNLGGKLEEAGIKLVKEIRALSKEKLVSLLGPKTGEKLWEYSRGIDKTEVGAEVIRKSVSAEVNWGVRFETQVQAEKFFLDLSGELQRRLLECGVKGSHLTVKIMIRAADAPRDPPKHLGHGRCDVFNKSASFLVPTNEQEKIAKESIAILRNFGFSPGELRGIGLQMTKLEPVKPAGRLDGSQKRLFFRSEAQSADDDPIVDDDDASPSTPPQIQAVQTMSNKPNAVNKTLNTKGSQFLLPPDDDDVYEKFLPNESQLDLDTLTELPPEIRSELLGYYGNKGYGQSPSSKSRLASPTRSTAKRPPKKTKATRAKKPKETGTLTQANFIFGSKQAKGEGESSHRLSPVDKIDPEFLAALPPELQRDVLEQHRQDRLRRAQLNVTPKKPKAVAPQQQKHFLQLPTRPEKPFFTINHLSSVNDMRMAISEWIEASGEDGPVEEDLERLARYLHKVVSDERNLEKAVNLVKWLETCAGMLADNEAQLWENGIRKVKTEVSKAVEDRGLAPITALQI